MVLGLLRCDHLGTRSPLIAVCREEGRGSFEQIALLLQPSVLPAQRSKLVALSAREPILALTAVQRLLLDPVTQRLLADPESLGDLRHQTTGTDHRDRLTAELRRKRRTSLRHPEHPFEACGRKRSDVQKSGETPLGGRGGDLSPLAQPARRGEANDVKRLKKLGREREVEADCRGPSSRELGFEGDREGKLLSPSRRRRAVLMFQDCLGLSERRACRYVGQSRSTRRREALVAARRRPGRACSRGWPRRPTVQARAAITSPAVEPVPRRFHAAT